MMRFGVWLHRSTVLESSTDGIFCFPIKILKWNTEISVFIQGHCEDELDSILFILLPNTLLICKRIPCKSSFGKREVPLKTSCSGELDIHSPTSLPPVLRVKLCQKRCSAEVWGVIEDVLQWDEIGFFKLEAG